MTGIANAESLSEYIKADYLRACRANPQFSLRSYAKRLGVTPSELSKFMNGKREISYKKFLQISEALSLSPSLHQKYNPNVSNQTKAGVAAVYKSIDSDTFDLISNWHYFAILELSRTKDFVGEASWIAQRLGLTEVQTKLSLEKLIRLGFIEVKPSGKWINKAGAMSTLEQKYTRIALRNQQSEFLEKSKAALEEISQDMRDHTSMTMAIDPTKIAEAKKLITKFRREISQYLEQGSQTEVYNLSIGLFPLTKLKNEKTKNPNLNTYKEQNL